MHPLRDLSPTNERLLQNRRVHRTFPLSSPMRLETPPCCRQVPRAHSKGLPLIGSALSTDLGPQAVGWRARRGRTWSRRQRGIPPTGAKHKTRQNSLFLGAPRVHFLHRVFLVL